MKISLIFLILLFGCFYSSFSQDLTIDLKEIKEVVTGWSDAHNTKSISTFEKLYADEVFFYAQKLPRISCLGIKSKRLQSNSYFHHEIVTEPVITAYSSNIIKASFVKRVTSGSKTTNYDAYLLLKRYGKDLLIICESDLIADGKAKFSPDLGQELKPSYLSEARHDRIDINNKEKPGGFGLKNYWAKAMLGAIESSQSYFSKWVKGKDLQ